MDPRAAHIRHISKSEYWSLPPLFWILVSESLDSHDHLVAPIIVNLSRRQDGDKCSPTEVVKILEKKKHMYLL